MTLLDAQSVFGRAAEIPDPVARAAFLDGACAGRPEVRAEVDTLLRALGEAGSFMGRPAAGADATREYDGDIPEGEGTVIGPYTLREQIGEGGMGLVFVAEQTHPVRRKVALKVIKPGMDTKQVVARFEAERQALALMDHPNIAKVLDAGTTASGLPYFVMELVRGVPITEYADANKFTPQQRLELFVQVCHAVQHAHQKGIIHRDLKPSNILVAPHDGVPVVKVIDFGVAKAVGQTLTDKTIYTRFAQMIGTPLYMSPEQAEINQLDVDTRSDVYALGVVLYELLTGTTPFDGERFRKAAFDEMRRIIKEEEPPRPSTRLTSLGATLTAVSAKRGTDPGKLAGVIRGELDWIVMRCLEKDRTRRYDGAAALVKDVHRYLTGDAVEACPPTLGYRLKKAYRRNRNPIRIGAAFVLLLACGVVATSVLAVQARQAEQAANENADAAFRARSDADEQRMSAVAAAEKSHRVEDVQRRTRYAAEMTLLQTAYDKKNMPEVKRLLLAQIPETGEPDVRGPEWYYWDRRLNQQRSELRIKYSRPTETLLDGPFAHRAVALSADGRRLAVVVTTMARGGGSLIVRVYETKTGASIRERIITRDDLKLPEGLDVSGHPMDLQVHARHDGRRLLLVGQPLVKSATAQINDRNTCWLGVWDVDEDRFRLAPVGDGWSAGTLAVSEDLEYLCQGKEYEAPQQPGGVGGRRMATGLRVVRLSDGHPVLVLADQRWPTPVPPALSADGQLLVVHQYEWRMNKERMDGQATGSRNQWRRQCWKVGAVKPLWETQWEAGEPSGFGAYSRIVFNPDGASYSLINVGQENVSRQLFDLKSGARLPQSFNAAQRPPSSEDTHLTEDVWLVCRPDQRRFTITEAGGLCVVNPESWGPYASARIECLDGPPTRFAHTSEGLVTVHIQHDTAVVRNWGEPSPDVVQVAPGPRRQGDKYYLASAVAAPDESAFAVLITAPAGPGKAEPFPTKFGSGYVYGTPDSVRILDWNGRERVAVPCADLAFPVPGGVGGGVSGDELVRRGPLLFSADGTVLAGALKATPSGRPARLNIWDLKSGQERTSFQADDGARIVSAEVNDARNRLLLTVAEPAHGQNAGDNAKPSRTRLFLLEFPSGRRLCELRLPPDQKTYFADILGDKVVARNGSRGPMNPRQPAPDKREEVYQWKVLNGEELGLAPALEPTTFNPYPAREVRRATRVLRNFVDYQLDRRSGQGTGIVELWDVARMGPNDRPIFRQERTGALLPSSLSPDGTRLIVFTSVGMGGTLDAKRRGVMYDTLTGRQVLSLPGIHGLGVQADGSTPFGYWSADSQQFWLTVTRDGKLEGFDFRPREEPKK